MIRRYCSRSCSLLTPEASPPTAKSNCVDESNILRKQIRIAQNLTKYAALDSVDKIAARGEPKRRMAGLAKTKQKNKPENDDENSHDF